MNAPNVLTDVHLAITVGKYHVPSHVHLPILLSTQYVMRILKLLLWTSTNLFFLYLSGTLSHKLSDLIMPQTPHLTYLIFLKPHYLPSLARLQFITQLLLSFMPLVISAVSRVCNMNVFMPHHHGAKAPLDLTPFLLKQIWTCQAC